jgi:hypothetical protein
MRIVTDYAYLSEIYPKILAPIQEESPPDYNETSLKNINEAIKPYDKLRLVGEYLEIDNRRIKFYTRMRTGDNRFKILEHIKANYSPTNNYVHEIIDVLCTSTYKNDKKFISECQLFLVKKSASI